MVAVTLGGTMLTREQCLQFAAQCDAMARVARHHDNQARLVLMAEAWRKLADAARTSEQPN
jgi:hypothetical protein